MILLEGSDGSFGGKAHVSRSAESLYIKGAVVGEGGVEGGFPQL